MTAQPALELVNIRPDACFAMWAHGLPYHTVRWHFHPECEIHLITNTGGRTFVGDYIGRFEPGNLVLLGPNVPHNWLSEVPQGAVVPERGLILQFPAALAEGCIGLMPELGFLAALLQQAHRGLEFDAATGDAARPVMRAMMAASGPERIGLFFSLLALLHRAPPPRALASVGHRPDPALYLRQPLNHVLAHIAANPTSDLREADLATLSGYSASSFARAFRRKTGTTFVHYVNAIRLTRACEMLISGERPITAICYEVGFNNLANFNRQFRRRAGMSPTEFRRRHRETDAVARRMPPAPIQAAPQAVV
jgi:AraC-like DNA-binding protein